MQDESAKNALFDPNLSQQLHRALTADKDQLFSIILELSGDVLLTALRNPLIDENHLIALLKRRDLPEEFFSVLYSNKRLLDCYKVKFALLVNPGTPHHISSVILPQLYLMDLFKLCAIQGITPDQRLAAERVIIQRLPTQPLGNKLTLAHRGTSGIVEALLREGIPQVVEACLDNPHLKEGSLHQFLSSAQATTENISIVARSSRWKGRPNIRLAILKNPRTPGIWFTLFLPSLPQATVKELLTSPRLTFAQKELVRQTLKHR